MAKASKKYSNWRKKNKYPIGPDSQKKSEPMIDSSRKHSFKSTKLPKYGKEK